MFPLIGGIVQMLLYGTDLLWPMTSVALVMVYINIQQQNVSRDGMTGLNNRRRLDQYIDVLSKEHIKEPLCYSIMDIDYFKEINDNLDIRQVIRCCVLWRLHLKSVWKYQKLYRKVWRRRIRDNITRI